MPFHLILFIRTRWLAYGRYSSSSIVVVTYLYLNLNYTVFRQLIKYTVYTLYYPLNNFLMSIICIRKQAGITAVNFINGDFKNQLEMN